MHINCVGLRSAGARDMVAKLPGAFNIGPLHDMPCFVICVVLPLQFYRVSCARNDHYIGRAVWQISRLGMLMLSRGVLFVRFWSWSRIIQLLAGQLVPSIDEPFKRQNNFVIAIIPRVGDAFRWIRILDQILFDQSV